MKASDKYSVDAATSVGAARFIDYAKASDKSLGGAPPVASSEMQPIDYSGASAKHHNEGVTAYIGGKRFIDYSMASQRSLGNAAPQAPAPARMGFVDYSVGERPRFADNSAASWTPSIQTMPSDVERMSLGGRQAMIAAANVVRSGGTQAMAELAAYSILVKESETGTTNGPFKRKKAKKAAMSQATLIASMALLHTNETLGSLPDDDYPPLGKQGELKIVNHQDTVSLLSNVSSHYVNNPTRAISSYNEQPRSYIPALQPGPFESHNMLTPPLNTDLRCLSSEDKDRILYTTAKTRETLKEGNSDGSIAGPQDRYHVQGLNRAISDLTTPTRVDDTLAPYGRYDLQEIIDSHSCVGSIENALLGIIQQAPSSSSPSVRQSYTLKTKVPADDSEVAYEEIEVQLGNKKETKVTVQLDNNNQNMMMVVPSLPMTCKSLPKSPQKPDDRFVVFGFKDIEPHPGRVYFPTSAERCGYLATVRTPKGRPFRIISLCIPCYNEEAAALKRTIKTIKSQKLPRNTIIEVLVAMDGIEHMSKSMKKYITELFGISTEKGHRNNPFEGMKKANTVIVEIANDPDLEASKVHLSLLIKRKNHRKVNSQMWWLRSHAKEVQCEFTFGTDCGIVFEKHNIAMMLRRLDSTPNMSAVTGYLSVMSSVMQGDGPLEICTNPLAWFLRQLQSCDIELSQSTTKSLVDTIGYLPVLPGPCTLFRYQHLAGVLHEYFSLMTKELDEDSNGIVLGNVQLAEDRFPPVLLTFRDEEDCHDAGIVKPCTGFVRDALFYFEAEKPLGQFVKQRRRWINGAFFASYWVLKESWIRYSAQSYFTKVGSWTLISIDLLQGAIVRLFVPATIACGLSFMCTILPAIIDQDKDAIENILGLEGIEASQFGIGGLVALMYLLLYAIFMLAHTPRAVKVEQPNGEVKWISDTGSAYRPWLFAISFFVNAIVVVMFLYVGIMVFLTVGWSGAPLYFRILTIFSALPYVAAFLDGLVNGSPPNFRSFLKIVVTSPIFYVGSIWYYVWFPSYASARMSDLTWGNREGSHVDDTSVAVLRRRTLIGRLASVSLVISNSLTAGLVLGLVHVVSGFLNAIFFILLSCNILLISMNLLDMFFRTIHMITRGFWRAVAGELPPEEIPEKAVDNDDDSNAETYLTLVAGGAYDTTDESSGSDESV